MRDWNEKELAERRGLHVFRKLGYEIIEGKQLSPENSPEDRKSYKQVFLKDRLRRAVRKLNPWINRRNLNRAVNRITKAAGTGPVSVNSEIHRMLVSHISLEQDTGGGKKGRTVKFVDYDDPENNTFIAVSQMEFDGPNETIVPDCVIYLNGVPVGVIEYKSPTIHEPKEKAVKQLLRYQNARDPQVHEGCEKLFRSNHVVVAGWGDSASFAPLGAVHRHFSEWKDPYPATIPGLKGLLGKDPSKQDILLYGLFEKGRFIDMIRNYTVFEEKGGGWVKMVARYQQYRAVKKCVENLSAERGGVVWHTQGSGKTLTMMFLSMILRRLKGNPTILIVTDRKDLDDQISKTFRNCGFPNPVRAESIRDLKEKLAIDVGKTILTTIHKFQEIDDSKAEVIDPSSDIFVMADEAHRTQYNLLANFMRTALPNANYIGFTGTPVEKKYKNTRDTFGNYIDTYTIDEAVADEVTKPIKYEGRMPNVWVEGNTLDEIFDRVFNEKSDKEKELIKSRYATHKSIAESEERITQVCLDLIDHYEERIRKLGLKGQIVAVSRKAAALYKEKLEELNGPECAVIYSSDNNDIPLIKRYQKTDAEQKRLIERFKKPPDEDPLSLLIVCNMLITGFDAPVEGVMYLDKPLKEHSLLQAIARVNRTYPGKGFGLIVDYYGISENLTEALEMFSRRDVENALRPLDEEIPRLQSRHRRAMSFFDDVNMSDIEQCVRVLEPEDVRIRFDTSYQRFAQSMNMLLPHPDAYPYIEDLKALGKIRRYAKNKYRDENIDISGAGEKVRELIDRYIRAEGMEYLQEEPVSILDEDFEDTVERCQTEEAKASEMEHAIRYEIHVRLKENPVVYSSLKDRLEEIIEFRKTRRMELSRMIEEYGKLIGEIRDVKSGDRAMREGLTGNQYAVFETLKETAEVGTEEEIKALSKELTVKLEDMAVIDFNKKRTVLKRMRGNIKLILAKEGWDRCDVETVTPGIMELLEARLTCR